MHALELAPGHASRTALGLLLALLPGTPASGGTGDLTRSYPATLDYFEGQPAREWSCTKDDVWELESFHFEIQGRLEITLKKAVVVFGVAEGNVVWAAVFPEGAGEHGKPGTIRSRVGGDGEHVTSLWMRFNPAHLGELFPANTVGKHGSEEQIAWARRLCSWKISSGWQAGNLPVIPRKGSIVLDCETVEGPRRYFVVEQQQGTVELIAAFEKRPLPALVPMDRASALRAFDSAWDAFDREYAKFVLLPELDWKQAALPWRKRAEKATSTFAAAAAIDGLVSQLHDLHAWVRCGDEFLQSYSRPRPLNASYAAVQRAVPLQETRHDHRWGRTEDGIGYVVIYQLNDRELGSSFDHTLEQLADCWSLVVDLRFCGGGDELLGREVAGRFIEERRVYSLNQYRSGPGHDQLGPLLERELEPRGPWRFESPVVCLPGQKTFSSAESLALMFAQCPQVTTLGDRTGGSSGNPRTLELEGGIRVNLPRWNDMDPEGKPIENAGIAPDVRVEAAPAEFTALTDPVLEAAFELLRRAPPGERRPGRR